VFSTLHQAIVAGYQVYDRAENGYLVRMRTGSGWAFAVALCRTPQ